MKAQGPKAIVFTDWDGTVTLQDSNDYMTDTLGFGLKKRKDVAQLMLNEKLSFRDGFREMLQSITDNNHSLEDCIKVLLKNIHIDPGFKSFLEWCRSNNIPLYVISSGMKPIINALLKNYMGEKDESYISIIANDAKTDPNDKYKWEIVYRDETPFGHDKSRSINKILSSYKESKPMVFYCGDGISDLSASKCCDVLFARSGENLVTYCNRQNIPYEEFSTFNDIKKKISETMEELN